MWDYKQNPGESSVDFFEEQGYKYETTILKILKLDHLQRHEATKASHKQSIFFAGHLLVKKT